MKKRYWIPGLIIVILIAAYFLIGNFFYNLALNPATDKDFMVDNDNLKQSELISKETVAENKKLEEQFEKNHPPKNIEITSDDDLKLHALFYEQEKESHKWVIGLHGYTGENIFMTQWARHYYDEGYHFVAPNFRGHGDSEGDYIGMGWDDRKDVLNWIDKVISMDPEAEIVVFGVSMGGATVMMTSGEKLPDNVKVLVEDCGYTSAYDVFVYQLHELYGLPPFPVLNAADTMAQIRAGYSIKDASALKQLKNNKTPILFIHGEEDKFVPYEMVDQLYAATDAPKEKLIIPKAGHAESEEMDPEKYWTTVFKFVGKYIN